MNRFINIEVEKAQPQNNPSSRVTVTLGDDINFFFPKEELPLEVKILRTHGGEILDKHELTPGMFFIYNWFEGCTLIVSTSKGVEIGRTQHNSLEHGTQSEIAFDLWCASNLNTKGVAIGVNDGSTGEWVNHYHNHCFSNVLLVEASDYPFTKLKQIYGCNKNATLVNKLITPEGGKVKFYEALEGGGYTNSTSKSHLLNFYSDIQEIEKDSMGINELLLSNQFDDLDWLHIDVEGIDDQLIMALDFNKIKKPKIIIYEKVNNIDREKLEEFLHSNGYNIWVDVNNGLNDIAFLK
tara:strand:+ start:297 stop:1181 length:885 start_codon:yes stop_codon:yes gene_type:complete